MVKIYDDEWFWLNDTNDFNEIMVLPFGSAQEQGWVDSSPAAQNDEKNKIPKSLNTTNYNTDIYNRAGTSIPKV